MTRPGYFVIAHRDTGWVVRWHGGNHTMVLSSTSQGYSDRRGAERAILSVAREFMVAEPIVLANRVWDGRTTVWVKVVDERSVGGGRDE